MSDQFETCQEFLKETGYYTDIPFDMARSYDIAGYPGAYKTYSEARTFQLPKTVYSQWPTPVGKVLARRRSLRNFLETPLSLDNLGFLLWATQGITATMGEHGLRAAPSAGALYPIETYLVVRAVETLPQGTFHFNVKDFSLELLKEGPTYTNNLFEATFCQEMVKLAAVNFVWSAIIQRSAFKYYERAYRYIFEDVGHISENLQIACAALDKVGCTANSAFFDDLSASLFDLDMVTEPVLLMASVGAVSGVGFMEDMREYFEKMKRAIQSDQG
ncbi:SagB/ThcOx family dehydrogenase [Thermodesulfobacteriota bacterium]